MSSEETAYQGRFSFHLVPYFRWFLDRFAQKDVRKGVCMKSAQIGWTQSVISNFLGHLIHVEHSTAIAMFPKEGAARNFDREKFEPLITNTPELAELLPVKSRAKDLTALFKKFPGGFLKFVGSNSIADVKSTSARRLIIEEPDDCNLNLRGQGDAIKLLEERGKSYRDLKMLIGGTPSVKGVSSIDDELRHSDQNLWFVPCPHCGHEQDLRWDQVKWSDDAEVDHEIFGRHRPETARYACEACGSLWTDAEKNLAVRRGRAVATAPFRGVLGLSLNELYSPFANSRMPMLVERYLTAKHEEARGNLGALITFWNAALGLPWEYKGEAVEADELRDRALDYAEATVPAGGLVLTMGVDVQHDRVAVIVRAYGRGQESWLVLWAELYGKPTDKADPVWSSLDELLERRWPHASGAQLRIRAVSIDSGDGGTSDAVYAWVRRHQQTRGCIVMAVKGASTDREIFSKPRPPADPGKTPSKAAKYGLRVFQVGVDRAKDVLVEWRLKLLGNGPGRMHAYRDVRGDYWEQVLSEVKVPVRGRPGRKVWQRKVGVRNEALDCEVYAEHAARALRLHVLKELEWIALEKQIRQVNLLEHEPVADPAPADDEQHHDEGIASDEAPRAAADNEAEGAATPPPRPVSHTSALIAARQRARRTH